jgi:hypothetical protein
LEWRRQVLARLEWLKQADVGFGLPGMAWNVRSQFGSTGMAWNRVSWFWHDWKGLERKKYVLVLSE